MPRSSLPSARVISLAVLLVSAGVGAIVLFGSRPDSEEPAPIVYQPRQQIETSGFQAVFHFIEPWRSNASLEDYSAAYVNAIPRGLAAMDEGLKTEKDPVQIILALISKAGLHHGRGEPKLAYEVLEDLESRIKGTNLEGDWFYTVVFYKGVTALRMGENDNCVMCRGESSCIVPIGSAAVHVKTSGSRLAIEHFTEYLRLFPDDLEVKWLLNLAQMTLGEFPDKVDPRHRLPLDDFFKSEFDIGQFRDVSHLVGLDRLNQSGGAIMEDFDNDGLLDLVVTSWAPSEKMAFYRNRGDGTFEDRTSAAGLDRQMGGLYCVQTDYNNDGFMDIFIPRGSWLPPHHSMRCSLLKNNGNGTFTDVTREAGLLEPVNSVSSSWIDYDNDGFLDLFICCQHQPCKLYHNNGNGTFTDLASKAGFPSDLAACLGSAWLDYDDDDYPDLFVNIGKGWGGPVNGSARLYHNNRNGTFSDVTKEMGIDGPSDGFSCWAFDYDNDGRLDIFAACLTNSLEDVVKGLLDRPHNLPTARLYRNRNGKGFENVTKQLGLEKVYSPMGSNFGDLDNDGFLDFYLGTGSPNLHMLIPNRLFKNVAGQRFSEITGSSRTGHLQKGHGVSIADWDRNGTQDLFIQLGGAVQGDQFHNVLFQNPGQGNNWLSIKLVGEKSNRAAIGARIKVVAAGEKPLTVHRHVSSGSSFGANPLEQHIGLGKAERVARLEIHWPTSGTTQVFENIAVNQGIQIKEFAKDYQKLTFKTVPLPQ